MLAKLCDQCGAHITDDDAPFTLQQKGDYTQQIEPRDFCSALCVRTWVFGRQYPSTMAARVPA